MHVHRLAWAEGGFAGRWNLPIVLAGVAHLMFFSAVLVESWIYIPPIPWHRLPAPLPPPPPAPPPQMTDPRVFAGLEAQAYSSMPIRNAGQGVRIVEGVGIRFLTLPDIGLIDRSQDPIRRVWPAQALESSIVRRVIPKFPEGAAAERRAVSVFAEYVVHTDGSVSVLRARGPVAYATSVTQALERWQYRPYRYRNQTIEVVSRLEVRFDGTLVE